MQQLVCEIGGGARVLWAERAVGRRRVALRPRAGAAGVGQPPRALPRAARRGRGGAGPRRRGDRGSHPRPAGALPPARRRPARRRRDRAHRHSTTRPSAALVDAGTTYQQGGKFNQRYFQVDPAPGEGVLVYDYYIPFESSLFLKGDDRGVADPLLGPYGQDRSRITVIIDRETGRGVVMQTETCTTGIGANFCNEPRPITFDMDDGWENDSGARRHRRGHQHRPDEPVRDRGRRRFGDAELRRAELDHAAGDLRRRDGRDQPPVRTGATRRAPTPATTTPPR